MSETNPLTKDLASISVKLRGNTITGQVTDSDLVCLYMLFFFESDDMEQLDYKEASDVITLVQDKQKQLVEQLKSEIFSDLRRSEPNADPASLQEKANKEAAERFDRILAQKLFFKTNRDHKVRREFAARVIEIFPTIPAALVNYDAVTERCSIRLSSSEIMELIMSILGGLMGLSYEPPATEPTTNEIKPGSAIELQPQPTDLQDQNPYNLPPEVLNALSTEAKLKLGMPV